jgi:hypothetical protein
MQAAAKIPEKPRYAVRADHDRCVYEVYRVADGKTVEAFRYSATELSRGTADGQAHLARRRWNETDRGE